MTRCSQRADTELCLLSLPVLGQSVFYLSVLSVYNTVSYFFPTPNTLASSRPSSGLGTIFHYHSDCPGPVSSGPPGCWVGFIGRPRLDTVL